MTQRRDEEKREELISQAPAVGPGRRRIELSIGGGNIGNPGISVVIKDLYFEYKGERDPEGIPVGEDFDIKAVIDCSWPEGLNWVAGLTAVGGGIEIYDIASIPLHSALLSMNLNKPGRPVMPDIDVLRLDVQIWASDRSSDFWSPPPKPW